MFKLCPEIMKGLFQLTHLFPMRSTFRGYRNRALGTNGLSNEIPYILRQRSRLHIPSARTVFSSTESVKFLGPKIWELIPREMKELERFWVFKRAIKQ